MSCSTSKETTPARSFKSRCWSHVRTVYSDGKVNGVTKTVAGAAAEAQAASEAAVVVLALALSRVGAAVMSVSLVAFHLLQVPVVGT